MTNTWTLARVVQNPIDAIVEIERIQTELSEAKDELKSRRENFEIMSKRLIEKENELAAEKEKHRWIPVTERLPEDITDVLVVFDNGEVEIGYHKKNPLAWRVQGEYWRGEFYSAITHWKSLPEAPASE